MPFADRLVAALDARGFEVMIDRRDLPKLEDWERELLGFIRRADTVIFVVSPHSIASKACAWEVEQVRANAKRLAPVVIADVEGMPIPREISRINYLYFTDEAVFEARADELASALNTDVPWLREHTRLGELARRWLERGRPAEALIRGRDLDDADAWAARRPHEAPVVSEAHRAFLDGEPHGADRTLAPGTGAGDKDEAVPKAGGMGVKRRISSGHSRCICDGVGSAADQR